MPEVAFFISDEVAADIVSRVNNSPDIIEYTRSVNKNIPKSQKALKRYIKRVVPDRRSLLGYAAGTAIGFDAITSQLERDNRQIELDDSDFYIHDRVLFDCIVDPRWWDLEYADQALARGERPITKITAFFERLSQNSSNFYEDCLVALSETSDDTEMKGDFWRGVADVMMPFFARIETQRQNLFFSQN